MRAALYYRVSTPGQVDAYGLDAQKRLLPEYCQRVGWQVVGEYEEAGVSGESLFNRPAMRRLIEDLQQERFDTVIVIEASRLSRGSMADWEYLKRLCEEHDVSLTTPSGPIYRPGNEEDDFRSDIDGVLSKREKMMIVKRMKRGKREASQQGRIVCSKAPHGYELVRYGQKASEKRLEIRPEQASTITTIFMLVAYGPEDGPGSIGSLRACTYLNDVLLTPSPRGGRWTPTVLKRMVRNPVYKGEWYHGRFEQVVPKRRLRSDPNGRQKTSYRQRPREEWVIIRDPEIVPPIVSEALWEAANRAIDHRNAHGRGRPARKHPRGLLASYLRCPHCGLSFVHRHESMSHGRTKRLYVCNGRNIPEQLNRPRCHNHRWPAEEVEGRVWEEVAEIIRSPQIIEEIAADAQAAADGTDIAAAETRVLLRRLEENGRAADRVKAAYRAEVYTLEELQAELAVIKEERQDLEARLAVVEKRSEAQAAHLQRVAGAVDLCRHYQNLINCTGPEEKRRIIEALVEGITLTRDGVLTIDLVFARASTEQVGGELEPASPPPSTWGWRGCSC